VRAATVDKAAMRAADVGHWRQLAEEQVMIYLCIIEYVSPPTANNDNNKQQHKTTKQQNNIKTTTAKQQH